MCFSIYNQTNVMKLCVAAQNIQKIIDDGILPEAFNKNRNGEAHTSVVAFDALATAAAVVIDERKDVSPFLRYRKEIMGDAQASEWLRALVLDLCRRDSSIGKLFAYTDQHYKRIALECIASHINSGQNDRHFMELLSDIPACEESAGKA